MTIYPVEFHRRLEQKWGTRIDQILTVTDNADATASLRRTRGSRTRSATARHCPSYQHKRALNGAEQAAWWRAEQLC